MGRIAVRDEEKIFGTEYSLSRPSMWLPIRKACFDDVTKVEARDGKPRDSQRGRLPSPINDGALLSSFHTKMDGLRDRETS